MGLRDHRRAPAACTPGNGFVAEPGFVVDETRPIVDVITPSDFMWQWPRAFVESGLARLVAIGALVKDRADEIHREYLAREASPHVRMTNPTVLEIVATRR